MNVILKYLNIDKNFAQNRGEQETPIRPKERRIIYLLTYSKSDIKQQVWVSNLN